MFVTTTNRESVGVRCMIGENLLHCVCDKSEALALGFKLAMGARVKSRCTLKSLSLVVDSKCRLAGWLAMKDLHPMLCNRHFALMLDSYMLVNVRDEVDSHTGRGGRDGQGGHCLFGADQHRHDTSKKFYNKFGISD
jgi:hypothetical protein